MEGAGGDDDRAEVSLLVKAAGMNTGIGSAAGASGQHKGEKRRAGQCELDHRPTADPP